MTNDLSQSHLSLANMSTTSPTQYDSDSQRAYSPESTMEEGGASGEQCFSDRSLSPSQHLASPPSEPEKHGNGSAATVAVRGLKRSTSRDAIHNYFDNERQSGGGEVTDAFLSSSAEGTAFVTFLRVDDAENVKARRVHLLEDAQLDVVSVMRNQVLLGDLPYCLNEDLRHFVEAKTRRNVDTIKFGPDGRTAVVTFTDDIDLNQVLGTLRSNALQSKMLHVEPVAATDTVLVKDLPMTSMQVDDQLSNMFSARLGITPVTIDVADRKDYALVSFADPADAARVANSEDPYTLRNRELSISFYNEGLGPSSGFQEQPLVTPQPLDIKETNKVRKILLLAKHPAMMSRLKRVMGECYARFHESTNFDCELDASEVQILIVCTLTEDVELAHCLAASWPEDVSKALNNHLETRFYQRSAPYIMAAYCSEKIQPEVVKESVGIACDPDNERVHVFCDCERRREIVDNIVDEAQEESKKLTETKHTLDIRFSKGKLSLLHTHRVGEEIKDKFPNLSVSFDLTTGLVQLVGSDAEVGMMLLAIEKASQIVCTEVHHWRSSALALLLSSPEAQQAVENVCKATDPDGEVDFSEDGFQAHSFDKEKAEQMITHAQNAVREEIIYLEDDESKAAVKTREWESLRDSTEQESGGTLRIVENERTITLVAVDSSAAEGFQAVHDFINARRTEKRTVSLKMPLFSLVQTTLRRKHNNDDLRLDDLSVEGRGSDVVIQGNRVGVDAAEEFLRELENEALPENSSSYISDSAKRV